MYTQALTMIFLSFIGGILLNCMPCVFPILSLKIIAVVNNIKSSNKFLIIMEGLLYTAGVLSSMLLLSVILLIIRKSGSLIGWGYNMQSPTFIILLIYITFFIGLSFSGFYNTLPLISANISEKYSNKSSSFIVSFFVGALTTLIATPCTAPFMASAISFAILQSNLIYSIIIFQSLGLGIAFPYLLLSFFPKILTFLPKPGQWMVVLQEFLSFPMYLSTIWLLWILVNQTSINLLFTVLLSLLLLLFITWISRVIKPRKLLMRIIHILFFLGAIILALYSHNNYYNSTKEKNNFLKLNFSEHTLNALLNRKESVLVSIGAEWCLMCKINELVLESTEMQDILKNNNIIYMKGDFTNKNYEIAKYLEKFNRNDIPFYILYIKGIKVKILPQILTKNAIIKIITNKEYDSDKLISKK